MAVEVEKGKDDDKEEERGGTEVEGTGVGVQPSMCEPGEVALSVMDVGMGKGLVVGSACNCC